MRWAGPEGAWRRVTPSSGRLTLGLWVRGGRGLSLCFFSAFLRVLSHSSGSSLPSSLFIRQVLGAIRMYRDSAGWTRPLANLLYKNLSQVDIVDLHSCPDDDRSMAIETWHYIFSLLKANVRVGVTRSIIASSSLVFT